MELKDISKESYQVAEQFYEQYKLFESVIGAYKNCKFALRDYTLFYENITSNNTNIDLNIIHDEGVYLLTSNIILLRVFIDNVKKYISLSNLRSIKDPFYRIINTEQMKIIKVLRDYSAHFSLPIESTVRRFDLIKEKTSYNFYISKDKLLKNNENKSNTHVIKGYKNDKIYVNDLISKNCNNIDQIEQIIVEEFTKHLSEEIIEFLKKHISFYISDDNKSYFPNAFVKYKKEENYYLPDKHLGLSRELLEMLIATIE